MSTVNAFTQHAMHGNTSSASIQLDWMNVWRKQAASPRATLYCGSLRGVTWGGVLDALVRGLPIADCRFPIGLRRRYLVIGNRKLEIGNVLAYIFPGRDRSIAEVGKNLVRTCLSLRGSLKKLTMRFIFR